MPDHFVSLLWDVPDAPAWSQSEAGLRAELEHGPEGLIAAYHRAHRVAIPAFDRDGLPVAAPPEHLLDALARGWLGLDDDEIAMTRAAPGTVAVVYEQLKCDSCGAKARYELPAMWVCARCLWGSAERFLGPSHAVEMVVLSDVPLAARATVRAADPGFHDRLWPSSRPDGGPLAGFRRWGFDIGGTRRADVGDVPMRLENDPYGHGYWRVVFLYDNGLLRVEDDLYFPPGVDELDARQVLLEVLDLARRRRPFDADTILPISEDEAAARAVAGARDGSYDRYLRLRSKGESDEDSGLPVYDSAARVLGLRVAEESTDPAVLAELARHRDSDIRALVAANPHADESTLVNLAEDHDAWVARKLARRIDLSPKVVATLATAALLAPRFDVGLAGLLLCHPACPESRVSSLVERVHQAGTDARIRLAGEVNEAPPERRDAIHVELLERARRGSSVARLVAAVLGADGASSARASWLRQHESLRVRAHVGEQLADTRPVWIRPLAPVTADAVSVRLRWLWLEATTWPETVASDLGDAWLESAVRRVGAALEVATPYDFGQGDAFGPALRTRLIEQMEAASGGAVRELTWCHDPRKLRPVRRGATQALDIWHPDDPRPDDLVSKADQVRLALPGDLPGPARDVLGALATGAISRHRIWVVAPSDELRRAVGSTPRAASALHEAVQRCGLQPPDLVVDPSFRPGWRLV